MDAALRSLEIWVQTTRLSVFMNQSSVAWPISACMHFIGLSLLLGTVGLYDLRLLGVATGLSPSAMHRLIPWGVLGFTINVITGTMFFVGKPDRYVHNAAFTFKLAFLLMLGINVLVFYAMTYRKVATLGPEDPIPLGAKIAAATSLALWIGVICAGRMVAFFLP
jgi:uncharacterized protein DUF6644